MKKSHIISVMVAVLVLSSCGFLNNPTSKEYDNENISKVDSSEIPSDIETSEGVDYYTSSDLELSVEVNGLYKSIKYFSLDPNNSDLRIYDDMYFYQYDFFQMMPPSSSSDTSIYASLSDENDKQYMEEHRNSGGGDLQIDVKVSGIYKLIFDLKTLMFDIEYKSEITTPKYYTIETCTLQVKVGDTTVDHPMTLNGENFEISNVCFDIGSTFLFTAINYVSDYKFTMIEEVENKYACFFMDNRPEYRNTYAKTLIGGDYNVSINRKTYVVSLELVTDIEQASYFLKQYNEPLTPTAEHPYIFEMNYEASKDMDSLPTFYNIATKKVIFTPINDELFYPYEDMIFLRKAGNYKLILNVIELTIDAMKIE